MARQRKDNALNDIAGNPGKRKRIRPVPPKPESLTWRPAFKLTPEAAALFNALAKSWKDLGYIRESDMPALTRYAELLGMWKEACDVLRPVDRGGQGKYIDTPMTNGGMMKRIHPAFNVMTRTETQLQSLEGQFGFTPASRYAILAKLAAQVPGATTTAASGDAESARSDLQSPLEFFSPDVPAVHH